jgi:NADPH-dependent curcumin reductase CurA
MSNVNRQFRLAARPVGRVKSSDFQLHEEPVPTPGPNEALVRNLYLSLDPTNRVWMSELDGYLPPVAIGEVMRGITLAEVVASNRSDFAVGDKVTGLLGWQDYAIVGDKGKPTKLPPLPVPLPTLLGALGGTGLTAYFGLLEIGQPKPGETVVVSAAAGAVGSIVGQLAKIKGCRVVGLAGTREKCELLTSELGFDVAINYKDADWKKQLRAACPKGIDIDFENVGGEILDAIVPMLNLRARIVLCGLISSYNADQKVPGPNLGPVLVKRARIEGFIILDYVPRFAEGMTQLAQWMIEGKLKHRDTIVDGLENAPTALNMLFDGTNIGKLLVKVA